MYILETWSESGCFWKSSSALPASGWIQTPSVLGPSAFLVLALQEQQPSSSGSRLKSLSAFKATWILECFVFSAEGHTENATFSTCRRLYQFFKDMFGFFWLSLFFFVATPKAWGSSWARDQTRAIYQQWSEPLQSLCRILNPPRHSGTPFLVVLSSLNSQSCMLFNLWCLDVLGTESRTLWEP